MQFNCFYKHIQNTCLYEFLNTINYYSQNPFVCSRGSRSTTVQLIHICETKTLLFLLINKYSDDNI